LRAIRSFRADKDAFSVDRAIDDWVLLNGCKIAFDAHPLRTPVGGALLTKITPCTTVDRIAVSNQHECPCKEEREMRRTLRRDISHVTHSPRCDRFRLPIHDRGRISCSINVVNCLDLSAV
jgi:hypothetical protein